MTSWQRIHTPMTRTKDRYLAYLESLQAPQQGSPMPVSDPLSDGMSDPLSAAYYLQYLEEIDAGAHEVRSREADFLEDMLRTRPASLSPKQVEWIRLLVRRYLHEEIA
jgi:hypothetical protein